MHRHADLRPHPLIHLAQLAAARVAGDMHQRVAVLDDLHAEVDQPVLDLEDRLLVAGDGARGKHHRVAGCQRHRFHLVARQLGQRRQRLALAAGADDHQVLARDIAVILFGDELRQAVHVAELASDIDDALQRAAEHQALPSGIARRPGDRDDAPDIGGKGGDRDAALGLLDDALEALAHRHFRWRFPFPQSIGGIADQRQNALVAIGAEARLVGLRADRRLRIDLPVARVDDGAGGRCDGERHRLGNGVRDRDGLDLERPDRELLAGPVDRCRDLRRALLALPLGLQQASRERRHPDRRLELRPDIEQRPVMVLMRVGDDDAAQPVEILLDEAGVGQDQVDARMRGVRKGDADIDDDPFALIGRPIAKEGEVHADLADAAERREDKFGVSVIRHEFFPSWPFRPSPSSNSRKSV